MAKMTGRKQQIYDWLQGIWGTLVSDGMEENTVQELYRGRGSFWSLKRSENPWLNPIVKKVEDLRKTWRKAMPDVLQMFWEVILIYYHEIGTPNLPEPAELPGTPVKAPHSNGHLKHSKDTIKLGERLLDSRFMSLRRDIEKRFAAGEVHLNQQILEAIKSSNGPVVKKMGEIEESLAEIREKRLAIERKKVDLSSRIESSVGRANEKIAKIKAESSEKTNDLKVEVGVIDKEDWAHKDAEASLTKELVEVEEQHEANVRARFTEAQANLEAQRLTLLRDLDLQREQEIDSMWSEHLPSSIKKCLERVPKIAQVTGQLPKEVQKLIAAPQP